MREGIKTEASYQLNTVKYRVVYIHYSTINITRRVTWVVQFRITLDSRRRLNGHPETGILRS